MRTEKLTVKAIILSFIFSCGILTSYAQENIYITPYQKTDYSIISVLNPSEASVRMKIYDLSGNVLFSQKVDGKASFQKIFDFSYLEDGTYKVVMVGKETNLEKDFEVANKKLAVAKQINKNEKTIFKASDNSILVSYFSTNNKEISLSITDATGNQIFDADYSSEPTFSRRFDVSALPRGEYNVQVVSDEKAYDYAFEK